MEVNTTDDIEIFQSNGVNEDSDFHDLRIDSRNSNSDFHDSFHDSGSFSADYTTNAIGFGNDYAALQSGYVTLESASRAVEQLDSANVDTKDLRKIVQQQTQNLDPDTANLLSMMCVALEKANDERNSFEQMLRQRHSESLSQLSEINQEVEEQIGQERERLDRDFKERQEQMRSLVQSEMSELQSRLDLLESENSQLKCNLEEVDRAKNELTDEYEDLKRDNRYLEESLSVTKDELHMSKNVASAIKAEQMEELKEREKTIEEFTQEAEEDRSSLLEQIQELERERARLKEERDELEAFKSYWIQSGPHRGVTTVPHGVDEMTPPGGSASGVMDEGVIGGGGGGIDIHGVEGILLPTTSQSEEDEFWVLDPKSKPAVDTDDTSHSDSFSRSRSRGSKSSTISLDSVGGISHAVNEHIREAESTTNLYTNTPNEKVFKVVFLGDTCVGKTSFIQRFHCDQFQDRLPSTVGIDFLLKSVMVRNTPCTLQLWDTCGQEKFRALTRNYFRKADGVILMYDVTRPESFYSLKTWMEDVTGFAPGDVCLMIVGNKADLTPLELDAELVKATLGNQSDFSFTEVSSRNGQNVTQCMTQFTSRLILREEDRIAFPESTFKKFSQNKPDVVSPGKKKKCCIKN
ncbi:ras-related protein Rab-44-like isoform X2 [Symsagittifera roscoffensis]|uniref:ras-related protein Rab-44-like isoform X2 n=1 Tax=Symsagittifera roscoffensis TaxID=84072 RepID=UPI00307C6163